MLVWKRLSLLTTWVAQCFLRHLEAVSSKYPLCLSSFVWTTGFITRSFFFEFQYESLNFVLGDSRRYCDLSQYHLSHLTTHQQWCPFIYTFQLTAFQCCLACKDIRITPHTSVLVTKCNFPKEENDLSFVDYGHFHKSGSVDYRVWLKITNSVKYKRCMSAVSLDEITFSAH